MQGRLVVTRGADRVDHIQPLSPQIEHFGQQLNRVLTVSVHDHHHLTGCRRQASRDGRLLAEIATQLQKHHFRILGAQLLCDSHRVIAAAIVDDDQFHAFGQCPQSTQNLAHHRRQILGLVVRWQDARKRRFLADTD